MDHRSGRHRAASAGPRTAWFRVRGHGRGSAGAGLPGSFTRDAARKWKMTPVTAPTLSETTAALCLIFILLVPCAAAGLALINAGLGRARSAAHAMLSTLCVLALAALVYFAVG